MKHRIAVLLFIVLSLAFCGCYWFGQNADLVLKNGVVFTGNSEKPFAEAVAVHKDRILLVGDNDDVDRFVGPKTRNVDLKGRFACAGFNDAHVHLYSGGKQADELDLTGVRSVEELQQRVLKPAWELASKQPGAWRDSR